MEKGVRRDGDKEEIERRNTNKDKRKRKEKDIIQIFKGRNDTDIQREVKKK